MFLCFFLRKGGMSSSAVGSYLQHVGLAEDLRTPLERQRPPERTPEQRPLERSEAKALSQLAMGQNPVPPMNPRKPLKKTIVGWYPTPKRYLWFWPTASCFLLVLKSGCCWSWGWYVLFVSSWGGWCWSGGWFCLIWFFPVLSWFLGLIWFSGSSRVSRCVFVSDFFVWSISNNYKLHRHFWTRSHLFFVYVVTKPIYILNGEHLRTFN